MTDFGPRLAVGDTAITVDDVQWMAIGGVATLLLILIVLMAWAIMQITATSRDARRISRRENKLKAALKRTFPDGKE